MAQKFLSGILSVDGSNSSPSYSFMGRTNTGIYAADHGTNDRIWFAIDGSNRFYIDANGANVIGNLYVNSGNSVRNYSGIWQATTGTTENGFVFTNTADNQVMFEAQHDFIRHTSDGAAADGAALYLKHANNNSTDTIGTIFFGNNADATLSKIVAETNGANNTSNLKFITSDAGTIGTALTLNADNSATFEGDVVINNTKLLKSSNNPTSNYLDFDDDTTTHGPDSNITTLGSVSGVALATNLNDGGGGTFTVSTGSSGTRMLTIATDGDATFAGTIGSGAITSTGKISGTEIEGTSLDINGDAQIDGILDVNTGVTNTVAIFESTDDKAFIRIKDDDTDTYLISKDNKFSIGESSSDYNNFKVDISSGNTNINGTLSSGAITSTGKISGGELEGTSLDINGSADISSNLTVHGTTFGLYHGTVEDDYYFDSYSGTLHLATFVKNSRSDIIRYQSIGNLEYWNGSSWQDMTSQLANVKKLLDGRQDTSWAVPSTYYKFRFTVSPSTTWPLRTKIGQQLSWSGSQYPGSTMLVEEDANDGNGFQTLVTADFGGSVGGSQTPLNSNNNGISNWGLMFKADSALHTGKGGSQRTRITVDYYGWSPSNSSHVVIPLQNLFITSNYAGTENTDYTNLLDYDRNATFAGNIRTTVDIGRDDHNRILFSTDDSIILRVADTHRARFDNDGFKPYADSSYDLGSSSLYWKDAYIDTITTTGNATVNGTGLSTIAGQLYVGQTSDYFGSATNIQLNSGASNKNVGIRSNILYLYSYGNGSEAKLIFGDGSANFGLFSNDTEFALYNYGTSSNSITVNRSTNAATFAGNIITGGFFQTASSSIVKKYVSSWNSGVQTHDIIYNGWYSNTGDFTYLKAAGNNTGGHGIILAADNGTYLGTTDIETGGVTDSATAPLTNTWAYFRNATAYIKGDTTFAGDLYVNGGNLGVGTDTPDEGLHILDTTGAKIILNTNANTADSGIYMSEGANGTPTQNGAYMYYDATGNNFKIATGAASLTDRLTIARDTGNATLAGDFNIDSSSAAGSTILDVQGTAGQLFSVTNSLTGDLFSVSDVSGIPIFNVNSSGLVTIDGALDSFNVTEYIRHEGDTNTNIQFLTGQMILKNAGGKYINLHSNGIIYYSGSQHTFYNAIVGNSTVTATRFNADNNISYYAEDSSGTSRRLIRYGTDNNTYIGDGIGELYFQVSGGQKQVFHEAHLPTLSELGAQAAGSYLTASSTDLDSRYFTETEVNDRFTRKFTFDPGAGAGNRRYMRLFTVADFDASVVGKLSSAGDYGDSDRATYEIQIATRSNISFDIYQLSTDAVSDDYEFFYKTVGSTYEIWCRFGDYNKSQTFTRFSDYGTVTYNFDSSTQTTPSGLTSVTKSNIYHEGHKPTLTELGFTGDADATNDQDLSALAPKASPTFTGIPAAPTAAAATSTTQIATTAFVSTAVSNLVDGSPALLNTLDELAAAIGDDENFSTTITTSIGTKLPLAGGTLDNGAILNFKTSAGNVRGSIQATGTNDEHFIIATSGGEDIAFKDGGVSGTTNLISRGDGNLWVRGAIQNGTIDYSQLNGTVPTWNQNTTGSSGSCTGNAATATTATTATTANAVAWGNITSRPYIVNASNNSSTATTTIAGVAHATYSAAFFDFVIKNGTNVRAGVVYACHDGASTPLVEFAETSTVDLGDTSDVTLSVDISGTNMRLRATTTSSTWTIKTLIRAI